MNLRRQTPIRVAVAISIAIAVAGAVAVSLVIRPLEFRSPAVNALTRRLKRIAQAHDCWNIAITALQLHEFVGHGRTVFAEQPLVSILNGFDVIVAVATAGHRD